MKTRSKKRSEAKQRQEARSLRTDIAQLKELTHRPGESKRERNRLYSRIDPNQEVK